MNYWWVNHKQTFKKEFEGAYIWSSQANVDGSFNQTYVNLTETSPGDLIFSFSDTLIKAVGVITGECETINTPNNYGLIDQWNGAGYLVPVNWTLLDIPFKPKSKIDDFKNLLPEIYSPIQQNGNGNQKCYLASISVDLGIKLLDLIQENNNTILSLLLDAQIQTKEDEEEKEVARQPIAVTEKEQLIMARKGQGIFKSRLLNIENRCRVTGITDSRFLTASHIKPWRDSSNHERLDGNNGLMLSPHLDRLFDKGWITFSDNGEMLISNQSVRNIIQYWHIPLKNVGQFNETQKNYLNYHRTYIFRIE